MKSCKTKILYVVRHYLNDNDYIQFESDSLDNAKTLANKRWNNNYKIIKRKIITTITEEELKQ